MKNYHPIQLAEIICSKKKFPNIHEYVKGEYNGRPDGSDLPPGSKLSFRLLSQDKNSAVVNVEVATQGDQFDYYMYFEKHDIWKVIAVRKLAMTWNIRELKDALERFSFNLFNELNPRNVNVKRYLSFNAKVEYEFELNNAKLTLASDRVLATHFRDNKDKFKKIINNIMTFGITKMNRGLIDLPYTDKLRHLLNEVLIRRVGLDVFYGDSENVLFTIGGILHNTVGYLFATNEKKVPTMDMHNFIVIRRLEKDWFLYKTRNQKM